MHIPQRGSPIEAFFEFCLDRSPILVHVERCGKYHYCYHEGEDDDPDYDSYFAHTSLQSKNPARITCPIPISLRIPCRTPPPLGILCPLWTGKQYPDDPIIILDNPKTGACPQGSPLPRALLAV